MSVQISRKYRLVDVNRAQW